MGDMAEVFNDLKKLKAEQRESRATTAAERLAALGVDTLEQSKHVLRVITPWGSKAVMYYPTSGTWQHRGKTLRGTPEQLKAWLFKNKLLGGQSASLP